MNYIDQFINFVSTLYTPRRACTTLFMLCGVVVSLSIFLPLLHLWLAPVLRPTGQNYENYILLISLIAGISLGIVIFSIIDFIVLETYEHFISKKKNLQSQLDAIEAANIHNNLLLSNFIAAYAHLSNSKITIIRSLITFPTRSFFSEDGDVKFLEKSGWIEAIAYISDEEKVYQINQTIKLFTDKKWNEEVSVNTDHFHNFDIETSIKIINAMSNVKTKAEIELFNISFFRSDIEKCFELNEFTETVFAIKFKERYESKFSELHNKHFRSERLFSITTHNSNSDVGNIPF